MSYTKELARIGFGLRRRWDETFGSSDLTGPPKPILFGLELIGPPLRETDLEAKPVGVQLDVTTAVAIQRAVNAVSVGRAIVANRDFIVIQAASLELLLRDAIERLKKAEPKSSSIGDFQTILSAISALRDLLSGMPPSDAILGTKAMFIKERLVDSWNRDQLSRSYASFNIGLFAGGLLLCTQFGMVSAATVARLIRGKDDPADALSAGVKLLSGAGAGVPSTETPANAVAR